MTDKPTTRRRILARSSVAGVVGLAHAGLFLLLGQVQAERRFTPAVPPIIVDLVRLEPPPETPPPPPPPRIPSPAAGGGAPSAPSIVRPVRPRPTMPPPEISAPPRLAPEQPLVIGAAPSPSPTPGPGPGQGGLGAGTGGGSGLGAGRGAGDGRFRLLRGPTMGDLRRLHPPAAFRQRIGGRATLSCRIRIDTRLEGCRVIDETPPGMGFGQAALAAAVYFRFDPPTRDGIPVDGQEAPITVLWP